MKSKKKHYWTHPSVLAFARDCDPVDAITQKARSVVMNALQNGWKGPPFDPLKLAGFFGVDVMPSSDVFDACTVPVGQSRIRIEYNPSKPRRRMRFSLAHELAHALFPDCAKTTRSRLRNKEMRDDDWQLELLCNIAAAELLMPVGTGTMVEKSRLSIDNMLGIQHEYDVSTEALARRLVNLTTEPCTLFAAARISEERQTGYRIDYSVLSRSSTLEMPTGLRVSANSVLSECTAVGYTAKGKEKWANLPRMDIECIGIPPYPQSRWPRIIGIAHMKSKNALAGCQAKYLCGDALEPRGGGVRIIAHIVNDRTPNWGGGFPLAMKKKWPDVQTDFRSWVSEDRKGLSLGEIHFTPLSENLGIVHMIAQHGYGSSDQPRIRYTALEKCLSKLASMAIDQSATIHMPKIGAGQAGGSWNIITDLIDRELSRRGINVTVYLLPKEYNMSNIQETLDFVNA